MRILNHYIPYRRDQKPKNKYPELKIVFFDELNCGWVMEKNIIMKTNSAGSLEKQTQAMMLFNDLRNQS